MARFNVYRNRAKNRRFSPYVIDIQSSAVDFVETRIVIPLTRLECMMQGHLACELFPVFQVLDERLFLHTSELAAVSRRDLGSPITSLQRAQHRITSAIDFLFNAY